MVLDFLDREGSMAAPLNRILGARPLIPASRSTTPPCAPFAARTAWSLTDPPSTALTPISASLEAGGLADGGWPGGG